MKPIRGGGGEETEGRKEEDKDRKGKKGKGF
jgi:hypothetical protein